ncbi:hypothetical protein C6501_08965 [Candidatus Poribacteria bacterium]|nr:MAG: hypothetical protein C6501_08965 [Candidatus Poribacteria bacterium]
MTSKLGSLFLIISVILLIGMTGCQRVQDVVMDSMPSKDSRVEAIPMKVVLLINYPEGGKEAYIEWIKSVAPTLQAFEEVRQIRSYDNQDPTMKPNRLVEFEFDSFLDMATYLNRPEIAKIMSDIPNHASDVRLYTFIQRSDYSKGEGGNWPVKGVLLIDYPLGGKQAYLEWVDSVSSITVGPPQLKTIASYDNYYGESPHRLVEFEFANSEDSTAYGELEDIQAIEAELDVRTGSWTQHTFELRSDYINE